MTSVAGIEPRPRRGSSGFGRTTVALVYAGLATVGTLDVVQALLPSLSMAFHLSPAAAGVTVSVATGALAVGVLPLTALCETLGRTPPSVSSVIVQVPLCR